LPEADAWSAAVCHTAADQSAPGAVVMAGRGHHRPGRQPMLATPARVIAYAMATPRSPGNGDGKAAAAAAREAGFGGIVPDLVTIWRVLTAVDPAVLDRDLGVWVSGRGRLSPAPLAGRKVRAGHMGTASGPRCSRW
jgi:hypothetical protein